MPASGPASSIDKTIPRPLRPALRRGFRRRCPNCGTGGMFRGYLAIRDTCPVCEEEFYHQRSDDQPVLATLVIVSLVMVPLIVITYFALRPEPLIMISVFSVGTVALSLYLLPRLKGMMIAYQWARHLHGFGPDAGPTDARGQTDNTPRAPGDRAANK